MNNQELQSEIIKTKTNMDLLFSCVNDKSISSEERSQYYKEYIDLSTYYIKLNQ